jgi:hypothetical protein
LKAPPIDVKTFQEFVDIVEKYYEPDQPLPSGKTPYGKATSSYYRQRGEFKRSPNRTTDQAFRIAKQGGSGRSAAGRGADNPEFDSKPDPSGRYDIETDTDYKMTVRDKKNNTQMRVRQKDAIAPGGKPVYDVEWYNTNRGKDYNPGEARAITRDVGNMFKNQVAPRLPSNSVLTNFPITNDTSERNTRAKLYSKVAGFGKVGFGGRQYAAVGRPPSSKQAAKGVQRITPLSGNLDPDRADYRQMISLDAERMHLPRASRIKLDKEIGKPRQIAPAKPSRPTTNLISNQAVKALKATPRMTAPALPTATSATPKVASSGSSMLSKACCVPPKTAAEKKPDAFARPLTSL